MAQLEIAGLPSAQQVAHPALLQVQLGDLEAVLGRGKALEPVGHPVSGEQNAVAVTAAAADPPTQLMQLGQPEPLGMVDHHDGGVGNIDADLDHGSGHEHRDLAFAEALHHPVPLIRLEPAVDQRHRQFGPPRRQVLGHGGGVTQIALLRLLDDRQHHVGLPPPGAFLVHEVEHLFPLGRGAHRRADSSPPRWTLTQDAHVQVTIARERQGSRDRRRGQQQDVGGIPLGDERRALLHPEAMLLVDHGQPEPLEGHGILEQGMGTDHDAGGTLRQALAPVGLLRCRQPAQQELRFHGQRCEQSGQGGGMLLGEQFRGRHQRRLVAILHGEQHGPQRDDGLAGADIAHEEAVHPLRRPHVGGDVANGGGLVLGERPGQRSDEPVREIVPDGERHALAGPLGQQPRPRQHELQVHQFVERQPAPPFLRIVETRRVMHGAKRVRQSGQQQFGADGGWQDVARQGNERLKVPVDQPADDLVAEVFRRRIHRKDAPALELRLCARFRQHQEFPGHHLAPVIEPDRPRNQQRLSLFDAPVEERLARPGALQHSRAVPQHRMKHPQTAAGGQNPLGNHPADARHFVSDAGARHRGDAGSVEIAVRKVPEEIPRRPHSETPERLGAALADALEKLDRGVEGERQAYGLWLKAYGLLLIPRAPAPQTSSRRTAGGRRSPRPGR